VLTTRGAALPALGRLDEAVALLRGAIALADEAGHIEHGLRARNNLLATAYGDMPISAQLPVLDDSVEIARRYGMAGHLALSLHARSDARFVAGLWDDARLDLQESEELPLADARRALSHAQVATLDAATGDAEAAHRRIGEADQLRNMVESRPQVGALAVSKAIAHVLLGEPAAAIAAIESASGGGQEYLFVEWHANAASALGDRNELNRARSRNLPSSSTALTKAIERFIAASDAAIEGRWDEAHVAYQQAIEGYRAVGARLDAEMAALAFDAYLGARFPDARKAGADAEAWFAERGGTSVVERYRAAFRGSPAPAAGAPAARSSGAEATSEVESR
jgi:tetratricopeptide (TPR) repeat protein